MEIYDHKEQQAAQFQAFISLHASGPVSGRGADRLCKMVVWSAHQDTEGEDKLLKPIMKSF